MVFHFAIKAKKQKLDNVAKTYQLCALPDGKAEKAPKVRFLARRLIEAKKKRPKNLTSTYQLFSLPDKTPNRLPEVRYMARRLINIAENVLTEFFCCFVSFPNAKPYHGACTNLSIREPLRDITHLEGRPSTGRKTLPLKLKQLHLCVSQ